MYLNKFNINKTVRLRRILEFSIFLTLVLIANGCTVQKKKGDISTLGKIYHNTTSKYNGYFNADVLMEESILNLESQYQENYNQLLPIYPYTEAPNPKAVSENLDKAIEKVSIVATVHEPSQWVDDCYVLMGKAQYLKQDYETAEKTFEFFADEFDPLNKRKSRLKNSSTKKKKTTRTSTRRPTKQKAAPKSKKKRSSTKKKPSSKKRKKAGSKKRPTKAGSKKRPEKTDDALNEQESDISETNEKVESDNSSTSSTQKNPTNTSPSETVSSAEKDGMFGHEPVYQEGLLWLARTYIHRERFSLAAYYIEKVEGDASTPKDIRKQLPAVKAFYHLKKKEYDQAVPELNAAIKSARTKDDRARYTFILAQIHQMKGRQDDAFDAYNRVVAMHPNYEMEFNAELNLAKAAWASGKESSDNIVKRLDKMANEEKNYEYRDQIYFTIGNIFLKLKDRDKAIENFRSSIKYNNGNGVQAAETYYALASYFYDEEEFDAAKYHYDSTLITLPKADLRYDEVKKRSENLKEIAMYLTTIKLQDSLLRVSEMDPDEQRNLAAAIKKKSEVAANSDKGGNQAPKGITAAVPVSATAAVAEARGKQSNFFAYDINKIRRGQNDFKKKWGSRILEDNWRRSNRVSSSISSNTSEEKIAKQLTDDEVKQLLANVPFSEKAKAEAKAKIEDAYFNLGKLFRSKMEQFQKSVDALEMLLDKNPNSEFREEAYYYLYLSHTDLGNSSKANLYKQKLVEQFPESKYTLSITDPNYVSNMLNEAKQIEQKYSEAYKLFDQGAFEQSKSMLEALSGKPKEDIETLEARIDLLKAMCTGNLEGKDAYITALNFVVNKHPNTPEEARAKEILRFLKGDNQAFDPLLYNESTEDFKLEPDKLHYVLVVIYSDASKDMTDAKIKISSFNQKYHKDEKLRISSIYLNKEEGAQLILVRKFRDMEHAMNYYNNVQSNKVEYVKDDINYEIFPVTQQGYREIIKQKTVNNYRPFFENNYLNEGG